MKKPAAIALLAAPLLLAAYGLVRIVGKSDGVYGPGLDWQAAHLLALAGVLLFVPGVLHLGRLLARGPWRTGTVAATMFGLAASTVQFGADIWFALRADDKAGMQALSGDFGDIPGVDLVVYQVGPQLFFVGLLALTILAARSRRLPWWSPAILLVGIVLPPVTLDLLPLSGLLILAALWPAARAAASTAAQGAAPHDRGDGGSAGPRAAVGLRPASFGSGVTHSNDEVYAGPPPRITP
ncbi:hypothetical protein [Catellatospora citrea]|uniref:Uncharacterized protein n=1 Tax=Catellatospora citrea TaxID=53366 RepID=A0A8J3NZI8_9ACTN|nr:hypothetical protein [Catellatospora citrea]RKE12403.1 hypothetical protein C8E86_7345 [Catellatospora citrea]GIF96365.1 hypothetical protein Cci01nite_14590 [Catellatospora citrea]